MDASSRWAAASAAVMSTASAFRIQPARDSAVLQRYFLSQCKATLRTCFVQIKREAPQSRYPPSPSPHLHPPYSLVQRIPFNAQLHNDLEAHTRSDDLCGRCREAPQHYLEQPRQHGNQAVGAPCRRLHHPIPGVRLDRRLVFGPRAPAPATRAPDWW